MAIHNLTSASHISITFSSVNSPFVVDQVYALDNLYSKEEVETFYKVLQQKLNHLMFDHLIIDDFNVKVGRHQHESCQIL